MDVPVELEVFESLPDLVVAFDAALTIRYVNPFALRRLGYDLDEILGSSLVDHLHPEDLERAAEVAGLIIGEGLGAEVTPALYRLRTSDGEWCPVEINSTPQLRSGRLDGLMVVVGRYSGDNVIQDEILLRLTSGVDIAEIIDLLPQFGLWRHPEAQYAVVYQDEHGRRVSEGSVGALDLLERFDGPDTPWNVPADAHAEVTYDTSDLPGDLRAAAEEMGLRGCMVLRVLDRLDGRAALAIGWSTDPEQKLGAHRYAVQRIARALDIILQWRSHRAELDRAAATDALSGLANRAAFFRRFASAMRSRRDADHGIAVLYVDLDGFKEVNDSHGHAFGDVVITAAAQRLSRAVRDSDLVARLGGDEFAVLCTGVTELDEITAMADRIVHTLAQPFEHVGSEVSIGASVGIAVARPEDQDHESLLAAADRALYAAKDAGRGRWRVAEP